MARHYNAFISYRHAPADSRIAAMVQRALEHYRIPGNIRQEYGIRRIERVFRDKEELPITTNLNEDISGALANSDFLIVICSTSTCQSVWVEKEIETFLMTHSKHQVLTVLADGEPYEVIPEILLYEDVTQTLPDGTEVTKRIELEPLSCDLRGKNRKVIDAELHRLAAPIIGCSFDELYQRQKKYRRTRLTILLTAVITFLSLLSAYFLWSSIQIRRSYLRAEQNYMASLENQSRYLASQSLSRLEAGDRITAIQLALAALPSDVLSRPLVPEAEYAMTRALFAYSGQDSPMQTVSAISLPDTVRDFRSVRQGARLWVVDGSQRITLWDADSGTILRSWSAAELTAQGLDHPQLCSLDGEKILIYSSQSMQCLDGEGNLLWKSEQHCRTSSVTALSGGSQVAFLRLGENTVCRLDAADGSLREEITVPWRTDLRLSRFAFSPDGKTLAVGADERTDTRVCRFAVRNTDGSWKEGTVPGHGLYALAFSREGELIALTRTWAEENLLNESTYFLDSDHVMYTSLYTQQLYTSRIDPASGALIWSDGQAFSLVTASPTLSFPDEDSLCVSISNKAFLYDRGRGTLRNQCELPASIVSAYPDSGEMTMILDNGSLARWSYPDPNASTVAYYVDYIDKAEKCGSRAFVYARQSAGADTILQYDTIPADPNWQEMTSDTAAGKFLDSAVTENALILLNQVSGAPVQLSVYDLQAAALRFCVPLHEETVSGVEIRLLGVREKEALLYRPGYADGTAGALLAVNLLSGSIRSAELPGAQTFPLVTLGDEGVYWIDGGKLGSFSPDSGEKREITALDEPIVFAKKAIASPEGSRIFCWYELPEGETRGLILHTDSGEVYPVAMEITDPLRYRAAFSPDGQLLALGCEDSIRILDSRGACISTIDLEGRSVNSLSFSPDGGAVSLLCADGSLSCYDVREAGLLRTTVLPAELESFQDWADIRWDWAADGSLIINSSRSSRAAIVDTAHWSCRGLVESCVGCSSAQDCFFTQRTGGKIGKIPRYSASTLAEQAQRFLAGRELTAEQKHTYGIS